MARLRNIHNLFGSRNFSLPTHEQRFMFFSSEDVNNGVMDGWIKTVQINQWERHDNENCTVFHFFSELRKSHGIKVLFNDACLTTLIDTARIGILARLNELLFNVGLLSQPTRKSNNFSPPHSNIEGAKKQAVKRIVDMVADKISQSKLSSKRIKHEDIRTNRIEVVADTSSAEQTPAQVQQVNQVNNIIIHEFILHRYCF